MPLPTSWSFVTGKEVAPTSVSRKFQLLVLFRCSAWQLPNHSVKLDGAAAVIKVSTVSTRGTLRSHRRFMRLMSRAASTQRALWVQSCPNHVPLGKQMACKRQRVEEAPAKAESGRGPTVQHLPAAADSQAAPAQASTVVLPAKTNSPRGPVICRDDTPAPTPHRPTSWSYGTSVARAPEAPSMSPQGTPSEVLGFEPTMAKGQSPASPAFHPKSPQTLGGPPPKSPESSSPPSTRRRSPMSASRMSLELTAHWSSPETVHGSP